MTSSHCTEDVALEFLSFLSQIRMMHWNTTSYVAHKELGALYDHLDEAFDRFVECMKGAMVSSKHPRSEPAAVLTTRMPPLADAAELTLLGDWVTRQEGTESCLTKACALSPSLQSIRDDIINAVNRCRYMLQMTK